MLRFLFLLAMQVICIFLTKFKCKPEPRTAELMHTTLSNVMLIYITNLAWHFLWQTYLYGTMKQTQLQRALLCGSSTLMRQRLLESSITLQFILCLKMFGLNFIRTSTSCDAGIAGKERGTAAGRGVCETGSPTAQLISEARKWMQEMSVSVCIIQQHENFFF